VGPGGPGPGGGPGPAGASRDDHRQMAAGNVGRARRRVRLPAGGGDTAARLRLPGPGDSATVTVTPAVTGESGPRQAQAPSQPGQWPGALSQARRMTHRHWAGPARARDTVPGPGDRSQSHSAAIRLRRWGLPAVASQPEGRRRVRVFQVPSQVRQVESSFKFLYNPGRSPGDSDGVAARGISSGGPASTRHERE
jgi:hypothetical protein